MISGRPAGPHGLQGIGAGFIPDTFDRTIYDEIITVSDKDAYSTGRLLGKSEGILCGITSGAALWAALQISMRPEAKGKAIVVVLPDSGDRYLSSPLYEA